MSRTLSPLFALFVLLATGCGQIGLQDLGASGPSDSFTGESVVAPADVAESFATALSHRDAKIKLDTSGVDPSAAVEGLDDLDLSRVAIAFDAHGVQGEDLEAQIVGALDDDRLLAQPVVLPQGPATWLLWTTDGVVYGALFEADSAALLGTSHKGL